MGMQLIFTYPLENTSENGMVPGAFLSVNPVLTDIFIPFQDLLVSIIQGTNKHML